MPRAMVADITAQTQRGAAYGLRQALDSVGAVLGPVLAVLLMLSFSGGIRAAMWVAVIPAVLAVLLVVFLLREPEQKRAATREPPDWSKARQLTGRYWLIVAVGAIFTAARFSDSFLVLRVRDIGALRILRTYDHGRTELRVCGRFVSRRCCLGSPKPAQLTLGRT